MNIHSLHHYLTNLSESEEHYRSGYPFSGWSQLPKVQIHGREMYRMFPDNLIFHPCTEKILVPVRILIFL